ncbi:MAG: hypothetical protein RLZZ422_2157 [Pseudomonadota bacterium]|jgi:hypothetical protein
MEYAIYELPNSLAIAYSFAPENVKERLDNANLEKNYFDLGEMLSLYGVTVNENTLDPTHELTLAIEEQDKPSYEWVLNNL